MKTIIILLLLVPLLVFAVSPAEFLQITPDARSAAMGEVGAALSDNVNGIYHNPACLGKLKTIQFSISHSLWLLDFNLDYAAFVFPIKNKGSFGAYFTTLWMSEVLQEIDLSGNLTDKNINFGNTVVGISYSSPDLLGVDNRVYVGVVAKYFSSRLSTETASAMLFDVGVFSDDLWGKNWSKNWNIGAVIQNLPIINPKFGDETEKIDINVKVGLNYELLLLKNNYILLGLLPEIDYNTLYQRVNIGTEFVYYLIPKNIEGSIRVGYKTKTNLGIFSSFTFGGGIRYKNYSFDYGFNSYEDMGNTHRMSLVISL